MSLAVTSRPAGALLARQRSRSLWLASATLFAVFPVAAASAADECGSPSSGTVTCTAAGNPYSSGVSYSPSGPLTLVVASDAVIAGPVQIAGGSGTLAITNSGVVANTTYGRDAVFVSSNQDAIVTGTGTIGNTAEYGLGAHAIAGQTGGDAVIVLGSGSPLSGLGVIGVGTTPASTTAGGDVTTAGTNGFGLYAASVIGSATASGNAISTAGAGATGILVQARHDAAAGFASVATQGANAEGVSVQATLGTITVRGGSASTQGAFSTAVDARATTGRVDVALTGPIVTNGTFSPGVIATSGQGDALVQVTDVTTSGASSYGILASGYNASIVSTGTLTTTGTGGQAATAAQANAGGGLASIAVNNASTVDAGARAALASSVAGDAAITATGTVQTTGTGARALDAQAFGGHASVTYSGAVSTTGDFATGVMAGGGLGATVIGTGTVTTSGAEAAGIIADSTYDPASVTAASVQTKGDGSYGIRIDATQSAATLSASSVTTSGRAADAVFVLSPKGATVTAGTVTATGDYSRGIVAEADDGAVTITSGAVSVRGAGAGAIVGLAGGAVTATSGAASSSQSSAIYLQSNTSTAALTVTGATSSVASDAVSVNATTAASLAVNPGGSITSGTNAAVISGTTTSIVNAGMLTGGSGDAIAAFGGPATIQNSGTINGRIMTKDGNDSIVNSGTFNAVDGSDFGGGTDVFTNTGTVNAAPISSGATSVTLANLESFVNGGTVSLANGRVGDRLVLPGAYSGTGNGALAIDVDVSGAGLSADRLVIGGAATGTTRVALATSGNAELISPGGAVIVDAGAGSSPAAFTLSAANAHVGFAQYGIAFDPGTNDYSLTASVSSAAQRPLRFIEGARNIWYMVSDTWSAHMRDLRDVASHGTGSDSRLWGQAYGSVMNRKDDRSILVAGAASGDTLAYRQDFFGGQIGYDIAKPSDRGRGLTFGATGGYVSSDLNFATSAARGRYDSANGGLYGGLSLGGAFVNLLGLYEHHWLDLQDRQPAYSRDVQGHSIGASGEAGFRLGGERFYAEPVATVAYVHTTLDDFQVYSSSFDFAAGNGLRGKLGLRVGYDLPTASGTHIMIYAAGNAVKEFEGRDHLDFVNNGVTYRFGDSRIGLYGEGLAGVRVHAAGRVSGFFEGIGDYGGRHDGVRGGGGRAGINVAL